MKLTTVEDCVRNESNMIKSDKLTACAGKGMLQARCDHDYIMKFDEALGLRELRAKVNGKAGITDELPPNRFSVCADFCYGTRSIEIVRKYLDSGVLLGYLNEDFWKVDRCQNGEDYYRFNVLAASVMTFGCTLPPKLRETLETQQNPQYQQLVKERQSEWTLKPLARVQMKKAIANYKDDEPYDFGNKTHLEHSLTMMFPGKTSRVKNVGATKIVEIQQADGKKPLTQVVGPPTDEEMGMVAMYPNHLCATCGADKKQDGEDLMACARCHDRKYCSKECQRKHWKKHKVICMRPKEEMEKFMESIPLDFVNDVSNGMGSMAFIQRVSRVCSGASSGKRWLGCDAAVCQQRA